MGRTLQNVLARMLPLSREQAQVYRLGEASPPSGPLDGYAPTWEAITINVAALATAQVRVSLQRDFTLLSLTTSTSSNVNGGFRGQLYDVMRKVRLADRGIQAALMGGSLGGALTAAFFLREPYRFQTHDSQVLVMVQNLETVQNAVQICLYGVCLPFNRFHKNAAEFPGGPVSSATPKSAAAKTTTPTTSQTPGGS
jgi:hypothetical protein